MRSKKYIAGMMAVGAFSLAACSDPCEPGYQQECTTHVGSGIDPATGKVVVVVVPVCFCVETPNGVQP